MCSHFCGHLPWKNPRISHPSLHQLQTLLHYFKGWYVQLFSQVVLNVNFARNGRKLCFCKTMPFFKSIISDKCAPTGLNWFKLVFLSIISDFHESEIIVTFFLLRIPLTSQISDWNQCLIRNYWENKVVRFSDWKLFRNFWPCLFFSILKQLELENLKYGHVTRIRTLIFIFLFNN